MGFKTWLLYKKIQFFGDKELQTNGKLLPCEKCGKPFKSFMHYGEWGDVFDSMCEDCLDKARAEMSNRPARYFP